MVAGRTKFATVILVMTGLCGCGAGHNGLPRGTFIPQSPKFAHVNAIQNYQQYKSTVDSEEQWAEKAVIEWRGKARVLEIVSELTKLPSAPSRSYARALVAALKSTGVHVDFEVGAATVERISYEEMARSEALTRQFFRDNSGYKSQGPLMPFAAADALALAIVKYSPSDEAAWEGVSAYVNGRGQDFEEPPRPISNEESEESKLLYKKNLQNGKRAMEIFLARWCTPERELNLSSLGLYHEMTGTSLAELVAAYSNYIKNRVEWNRLHPWARRMLEALRDSVSRARLADPSGETQAVLQAFVKEVDDKFAYFDRYSPEELN